MSAQLRIAASLLLAVLLHGCATAVVSTPQAPDIIEGIASWYGEEFAGRVTASGEIFDPMQLTAAHPALPFGTVATVTNIQNGQSVEVRINDRGPYIGNRIIDLSYAAASRIGLIEPGIGRVELRVIQMGDGQRRRYPAPVEPMDAGPPAVPFPLPHELRSPVPVEISTSDHESDFEVEVIEERGGVPTRRQVSADGRDIEAVPEPDEAPPTPMAAAPAPAVAPPPTATPASPRVSTQRYYLQLGAFHVESNAETLRRKAAPISGLVYVDDADGLYRVKVGPFDTREQVLAAQSQFAAQGLASFLLTE